MWDEVNCYKDGLKYQPLSAGETHLIGNHIGLVVRDEW